MKNNKKVLITGSGGLLGTALLRTIPVGIDVISAYFSNDVSDKNAIRLDVNDEKSVSSLFRNNKIDLVIHAASIGSVDICEKRKEFAYKVNVLGTRNIIQACEENKVHLLFLSSNAVFDGLNAPYAENDVTNPVNYYGETKVLSERDILKSNLDFTIVRLVLMYGWNNQKSRQNPVTWLLEKLSRNEKVMLVNDTYVNPLYNIQAAEAIWEIINKKKKGIYHVAGNTRINRYDFGLLTAEVFGKDASLISEVDSSFFSSIASRMPDTTFDLSKIKNELKMKPLNLEDGLKKMLRNKI